MTGHPALTNVITDFFIAVELTLERIKIYGEETHVDTNKECAPPTISRTFAKACLPLLSIKPDPSLSSEAKEILTDIQTVLQEEAIPLLDIADTEWVSVFGENLTVQEMAAHAISHPQNETTLIEAENAMLTARDKLEHTIKPQTASLLQNLGVRLG